MARKRCMFGRTVLFLVYAWFDAFGIEAQTLNIGVPEFSREINLLASQDPVGVVVLSGLTGRLLRLDPKGILGYRLDLAESVSVSADKKNWSFKIKNAVFHNGNPIDGNDVVYSLEQCRKSRKLIGVNSITLSSNEPIPGVFEELVEVELSTDQVTPEGEKVFPKILSSCPIIEQKSAILFGSELGRGSNIVSNGPFRINGLDLGREISLIRMLDDGREGSETILVRGFKDHRHALTALRTGTLDVFFTLDKNVVEIASKDPTLAVESCLEYNVVLRKGLQFSCDGGPDLVGLRYVG